MDPEIKKALDALRAELGKNVEGLARIDAIEKSVTQFGTDVKTAMGAIEAIRKEHAEREAAIRELQQSARIVRAQHDSVHDRRRGIEIFGMMMRAELARHLRVELPSAYRGESDVLRATLEAGATPGSYVVPAVTEAMLIEALEEVSDLLSRVEFIPGLPAASTISIPTLAGRCTLQPTRASVDTAMTQSDPTFGQMTLTPAEAYVYFPVDNRLLQMSALPLGQLLTGVLNDSIASGIADWLLNGDATSSYNSVRGILQENTAGYLYTLPGGKTAFADLTAVDMRKAMGKALKRGRARGSWLMSLDVQGVVEDLDRTGKVPVISYAQDGTPRIFQRPVVIEEGMPDSADSGAGKAFAAFGDLATYIVGLVGGIQIASSMDYLFGKNQTAFRGVLNMDIKRKPVATLITIKTAAQ